MILLPGEREDIVRDLAPRFFGLTNGFSEFQLWNAVNKVNETRRRDTPFAEDADIYYVLNLDDNGELPAGVVDQLRARDDQATEIVFNDETDEYTDIVDWSDEAKDIIAPLLADEIPGVAIVVADHLDTPRFETLSQFRARTGHNVQEVELARH